MLTKKPTATEVTSDVIEAWKKSFNSVFKYQTNDGKTAYFRSPTRKEIEAAQTVQNKPIQSNEILAKAVFLGGDEEIINEDKYFFGFQKHLTGVIKQVEGEFTEL